MQQSWSNILGDKEQLRNFGWSSTPLLSKLHLFLSSHLSLPICSSISLIFNIFYILFFPSPTFLSSKPYNIFFLIFISAMLLPSSSLSSSCLSDLRQKRLGPQHAPLHSSPFLSISCSWPSSSLNRRLYWGRDWGNGEGEGGELLVWVLHDSCCPVMKLGRSFKCLVCNGVSGTGLSFSPNSAFSAARRDPSLHAPAPRTTFAAAVTAHYPVACTNTHQQAHAAITDSCGSFWAAKVANFLSLPFKQQTGRCVKMGKGKREGKLGW